MKGNVIGFDTETNTGAVSGHDGHRYEFVTLDWHNHRPPRHGDLVDFAPEGQRATQIYLLEPEYVSPSLGEFYFSSRGRISRSQYWLKFFLPVFFIGLILRAIGVAEGGGLVMLPAIFQLIVLWPGVVVLIKRIHDRDKPGTLAWALYGPLIPATALLIAVGAAVAAGNREAIVGLSIVVTMLTAAVMLVGIWFFIEFGCMRGTIGANRFGPDPVRRR